MFEGSQDGYPSNFLILRSNPDKATAMNVQLKKFQAFTLGHRREGEFVLIKNENQLMHISVSASDAKKFEEGIRKSRASMRLESPTCEGWIEKTSIPYPDDFDRSKARTLTQAEAESQIAGVFRPWKRRYAFLFRGKLDRYIYYTDDEDVSNPKGYLAMQNCSNVRTVLNDSPEIVVRCAMLEERVKLYRLRILDDIQERSQLTVLGRTREWVNALCDKIPESKAKRSSGSKQQRRRTPVDNRNRTGPLRGHRIPRRPNQRKEATNTPTTEAPPSRRSDGKEEKDSSRTVPIRSARTTDDPAREIPPRTIASKTIPRCESAKVREEVTRWAEGKDILALIHDMPRVLPPTSPPLKRAAETIRTRAGEYLKRGRCSTNELRKLYHWAVRYCHPDKWVEANRGEMRSKVMCSEIFRAVNLRYEMMTKVFAETDEKEYVV